MHPADSYMRIVSHSRGQSLEMWIVPAAEWLRMRTSMRTSWVPHQNDRVSITDTSDAIYQKSWINSSTSAATCRIWRVVFVLQRHALCMLFPTCVRGNPSPLLAYWFFCCLANCSNTSDFNMLLQLLFRLPFFSTILPHNVLLLCAFNNQPHIDFLHFDVWNWGCFFHSPVKGKAGLINVGPTARLMGL